MSTWSPSSISPITPPAAASGETCPTEIPLDPPENRPSVTSAHFAPSPAPLRNAVGCSISCMPGPPDGPS